MSAGNAGVLLRRQLLEAVLQHLMEPLGAVAAQHRGELRAAGRQLADGAVDEDVDDVQAAAAGAQQVVELHRIAAFRYQPGLDDDAAAVAGSRAFLQHFEALAAPAVEIGGVGGDAEARKRLDELLLLLGFDRRPLGAGGDAGHGREVEGAGDARAQPLDPSRELQRRAVLHGGQQGVVEAADYGAGRSGLGGGGVRRRQQRERQGEAGEKGNDAEGGHGNGLRVWSGGRPKRIPRCTRGQERAVTEP